MNHAYASPEQTPAFQSGQAMHADSESPGFLSPPSFSLTATAGAADESNENPGQFKPDFASIGGTMEPDPDPASTPAPFNPLQRSEGPEATETAAAAHPVRVAFHTVWGPKGYQHGKYLWAVEWDLYGATDKTNGIIVQKVAVEHDITDCAGNAVIPGQKGYGGFRKHKTPYWEAWLVKGGKVYPGEGKKENPHDGFGQGEVGDNTKGNTLQTGVVEFFPNQTIPSSFQVIPNHPAKTLRATMADPGLTGGTGKMNHNIRATWDSCEGDGQTKVSR